MWQAGTLLFFSTETAQNIVWIQGNLAKIPGNVSLFKPCFAFVLMVTFAAVERGFGLSDSLERIYVFFNFLSLLGGRNLRHLLEQVCIKGNDRAIY